MFCAPSGVIPDAVLATFGFRSDDALPLSAVIDQTTHVARPLSGEDEYNGLNMFSPDNWSLTFVEMDMM